MSITKYQDATLVTGTRIIEPSNGDCSIIQNNYFGGGAIAESVPTAPTPSRGHINWISLFLKCGITYAIVAASLSLFWLGAKGLNEWNQHRETSAQVELARLRGCFNN